MAQASKNEAMALLTATVVTASGVTAPRLRGAVLAQEDSTLFLGEDFWPWMILAFGGAMVVGNLLALLRPPADAVDSTGGRSSTDDGDRPRPPLTRSVVLIIVGLAATTWGIASLLA